MNKTQSEITLELSQYIKQPEYYLSTMLARFGGQDFTNPYYSIDDLVTFLSQVFLVKNNPDGHLLLACDLSQVRFYKSVYIPAKDDEVLTEDQMETVKRRLKERDTIVASTLIQNIEFVARRIAEEDDTVAVNKYSRRVSIQVYARDILSKILEILETDTDVPFSCLEQIERINLILDGEEI